MTTAALALLTMASCSQDDLLSNKQDVQAPQKGELQVTLEDLIDPVTTRAAFVPVSNTKNTLYWQPSDYIEVLDEAMVKYDVYNFNAKKGSFVNAADDEETRVGSPKYALFGGAEYKKSGSLLQKFGWEYDDNETVVEFQIPTAWSWNDNNNAAGKDIVAYQSNIPMWGDAEKDGEGVKVSMHYLTAVLRVYMKNVPSNISKFVVEAFEDQACTKKLPIATAGSGTLSNFRAVIANGDEANADAKLATISGETGYTNQITVDVSGATQGESYLYIPMIAQYYGALKFWYIPAGGSPKLIKTTKPMTLERQKVYRLSFDEFEIAGTTIESINATLASKSEETGDVLITTTQTTKTSGTDRVIKIPAGMKANITLDLKGLDGTSGNLEIESVDGEYAGELTIDLGDAAITSVANIFVNLPKANVTFIGSAATGSTDLGLYTSGIVDDKLIVKSLTIASPVDGGVVGTFKDVLVNKESTDLIMVAEKASAGQIIVQDGAALKSIVVNGTANKVVDANGTAIAIGENGTLSDVTTAIDAAKSDVTIATKNAISGAITAKNLEISGKSAISGTIKTEGLSLKGEANLTSSVTGIKTLSITEKAKAANISIVDEGTATINVDDKSTDGTGDCEAITGTLTVGKKAKITLTQGYIGTITPQATAAADACTLTLGEGEGYTAIKTVSNDYIKPQNASTWNGKVLPNATYVGGQVWTACQLATVNLATANLTLKNNIDLGGEIAWAMPALAKDFFGFDMKGYGVLTETTYPTISNVKILNKDSKNADIDNAGLFSTITGTIAVKDFNITNATLTLTGAKKNAGILAGSATGTGLWVTNVNVSGSIETTAKFDNVGGLIGQAEAPWIGWTYPSTLDTKVVSVTLTKLQGRYNIGGVIGNTTSTAYFNKTKVDIAENGITVVDAKSFDVDVASDTKAGCVGMILGKADGNVRIDEANIVADRIAGKKEALGFKARYKTNATPQILFYFGGTAKNALGDAAGKYYAGTTEIPTGADATAAPAKATDKNAPSRFVLSGKYADWDK